MHKRLLMYEEKRFSGLTNGLPGKVGLKVDRLYPGDGRTKHLLWDRTGSGARLGFLA